MSVVVAIGWATRVDWSVAATEGHGYSALTTYATAVAIALIPYAALWQFLRIAVNHRRLQVVAVALVGIIGLIGYAFFWSSNTPTGGWELFIVFFWQSVAICCLHVAAKILNLGPKSRTEK